MYEYQLSSDALAWYTIMATCMLVSDIQLSIPKSPYLYISCIVCSASCGGGDGWAGGAGADLGRISKLTTINIMKANKVTAIWSDGR
jgi:hypothetical protein